MIDENTEFVEIIATEADLLSAGFERRINSSGVYQVQAVGKTVTVSDNKGRDIELPINFVTHKRL